MEFEWDEAKRLDNLKNHGLDFEDAKVVFNDEAYVIEDARGSMEKSGLFYSVLCLVVLLWLCSQCETIPFELSQ